MKSRNLITSVLCWSAVTALAQSALAQSTAIDRIKATYVACVQSAFVHHLGTEFIEDGNVAAAIERSFPDCQTKESASVSLLAMMMGGSEFHFEEARTAVDQLKLAVKTKLMRDFLNARKQTPAR
jgi:hypothetical protein